MQFGDWLDPDAPSERPWEAKTNSDFLANAFFAESARLVADAADLFGKDELAGPYRTLADEVAAATWSRWADHIVTTQTGCAVALQFRHCARVGEDGSGIGHGPARPRRQWTGGNGLPRHPVVLPALAENGFFNEAYLMLLRHEVPSWLYQVDQDATTVWERWDAIRPDGSIHPGTMSSPPDVPESESGEGHMLSFNHYAYGAVIDWVYRHVAGLAPDIVESRISKRCIRTQAGRRDRLGPGIGRQCVRQGLYFVEHHGRWNTGR